MFNCFTALSVYLVVVLVLLLISLFISSLHYYCFIVFFNMRLITCYSFRKIMHVFLEQLTYQSFSSIHYKKRHEAYILINDFEIEFTNYRVIHIVVMNLKWPQNKVLCTRDRILRQFCRLKCCKLGDSLSLPLVQRTPQRYLISVSGLHFLQSASWAWSIDTRFS